MELMYEMNMNKASLLENISAVYKRISNAAMMSGRNSEDIRLVAVTKNVSVERIREAVNAGLRVFGENRVQEAKAKMEEPSILSTIDYRLPAISWHLIGYLQKNKAKYAVQLFDLIHSVDSAGLAKEISRHAEKTGKIQDVLIEVKLSDEETKRGTSKNELMGLIKAVNDMKNLNLRGLMTIPPFFENPEDARPYFRELRKLRDKAAGFDLPELSMGMSNDFEVAIEEGATIVRIGTAIFGKRN